VENTESSDDNFKYPFGMCTIYTHTGLIFKIIWVIALQFEVKIQNSRAG